MPIKKSSTDLKVGDLVVLKSGGPVMTVNDVDENGLYGVFIDCVWFAGKKREHARFSLDGVRRSTDADK